MSVEKFIVSKEACSFSVLPNHVLQNLRDPFALGLWCYLMSLPAGWVFYKQYLKTHFGLGRDKLNKALKILEECGLVEMTKARNEKGQFDHIDLFVRNGQNFIAQNDDKKSETNQQLNTEKPSTGKPCTDFQCLDNDSYIINNKKINNLYNKQDNNIFARATDTSKKHKKLHVIPDDFLPTDKHHELCSKFNLNLQEEVEKFTDYHLAKGSRFADWSRALSNWLRNAHQFSKQSKGGNANYGRNRAHWDKLYQDVFRNSSKPAFSENGSYIWGDVETPLPY